MNTCLVPACFGLVILYQPQPALQQLRGHRGYHCMLNDIAASTYLMRSVRFVRAAAECRWLEMISRTNSGFIAYAGGWVHSPIVEREAVLQAVKMLLDARTAAAGDKGAPVAVTTALLGRRGRMKQTSLHACTCGCCHEMREQRSRKVAAEVPACRTGRGRRAAAPILPAVLRLPRAVCL